MKIQIKYYMTDGIDLNTIIGDEETFETQVLTFSDVHDIFNNYLMMKYPEELYATIKSIKVIDIP